MRRLLILLPVALVLAGCGQATTSSVEDFTGQERAVAQVVEDLQGAAEQNDAAKICADILARELVRRLDQGASSCQEEIERSIGDAEDFQLDVQDVTVTGESARATVTRRAGEGDERAVIAFVRESGGWRAADLAPGG